MDSAERMDSILKNNIVHLHVHSKYSTLDGFNKPEVAIKRAKELGMKAIAITDHNHVGGVPEWQKVCKAEGIKPILGCEMYYTHDTNILSKDKDGRDEWAIQNARDNGFDIDGEIYKLENPISAKTGKALKKRKVAKSDLNNLIAPYAYDSKQYHIILLAKNQKGWHNLVKLQSEAAEKCTFNGRYCCDNEMLRKYSEGLIMTTACIGNAVPNFIEKGEIDEAKELLRTWKDIFNEDLYLEIQPLTLNLQQITNFYYMEWAKEFNIKTVATTDSHYTLKEDHDDHDTLMCIGMGKLKEDNDRMKYDNEYWLRSHEEMIEAFEEQYLVMTERFGETLNEEEYRSFYIDAISNTELIADMIDEDIKLGADYVLFPQLDLPNNLSPEKYLSMICFRALYKYKKEKPYINLDEYERRLAEELNVINRKGYAPYMLIVQEYIEWANANGCPTGPGRGSAAGSLVLLLLGITKMIDPIEYKLLFFRFLTMDRTSPPDVDSDFEYYGRDAVIKHLEDKYGKDCVSHIGTFSELGVKSGIKDVGRVLNIDFNIVNSITKKIDDITDEDPNTSFKSIDKMEHSTVEREKMAWREFNELERMYPELFRIARKFEGVPRNMGVHASGILITPVPITDYFPTRVAKDGTTVALYTGPQLEELNAIKFDILGLKTLTVLNQTVKAIDKNMTLDDLYKIVDENKNDINTFDMIRAKETDGLFQIESNLFKGMIEEIIPDCIGDIIAMNALGRPGPLKAGMPQSYAKRKNGFEEAIEPLPNTWDLVEDTLGTICYQEQLMLIAKRVAHFDDNQSDSYLRKAVAKKKEKLMNMCRQWFIYGKINEETPEGYDEKNINQPMYDPEGKHGSPILGGINNGYDAEQLKLFWNDMEGYATYLFNLSHSACYSFMTMCTAYLKKFYTAKFMAALLAIQDDQEKIDKYIKVARKMNIEVKVPDINYSDYFFKEVHGDILFGLSSIKGVGASSIPEIIANRPYIGLEDSIEKAGKKNINKRVGAALIKSGAYDTIEDKNRFTVLNNFYDYRRDDDERYDESLWGEATCIELEQEVLGSPITYIPFWDQINAGEIIEVEIKLLKITEKLQKNNKMMAFIDAEIGGSNVRCLCFAAQYCKNIDKFDMARNTHAFVKGHKDDRGTLIIDKVYDCKKKARPLFMEEDRIASII